MSWLDVPFGEIADFRNGLNYSRENFGTGMKIISVGNFGSRFTPDIASLDEINPEGVAKAGDHLHDGDLLFVRSNGNRDLVGRVMLIQGIDDLAVGFSGFCIRARLTHPDANPSFYAYLFRDPSIRHRLTSGGVGANIANVSQKTLGKLVVPLPAKNDQEAIVAVLSAYDNLIATNQRRIALLEDAARCLYREWFVHLRFPGHESVPVKDGVPEGWSMQSLSSVAEVNARSIGTKDRPDSILYIDISSVTPGLIGTVTPYVFSDAPGRARRRVIHGDVIWSCVRPNRRSYALIWEPDETLVASTGFAVLSATKVPFSYMYLATTTDEFVSYLEQNATGAAYPAVTAKTFEEAEIVTPDSSTLESFDKLVLPMIEQMEALKALNADLARARDLLLPKLMSGQLDVSGIPLPDEVIT